jgi:GT2 family glycosyltransferase
MPERRPRTSLVVPLFNSSVYTRVFLLALREVLPGEPEVEVVLVDNASTDDTADVLAELAAGHRVVSLPVNQNFAGGCNQGAAAAVGELLFFVNNDMVPTRGFVSAVVETIDREESIAAVGSKLLFPGGRITPASCSERARPRATAASSFPRTTPRPARSATSRRSRGRRCSCAAPTSKRWKDSAASTRDGTAESRWTRIARTP